MFSFRKKLHQSEDISFSAVFVTPSGKLKKVPGFWDGGVTWKIRYSSEEPGIHKFETQSQPEIKGISGIKGRCRIIRTREKNPLYRHGFPVVHDGNMFYSDGEDFFWLGDTWWMGLCRRMSRNGFKTLVRDRARKGFTVIQIVAGLYPDMDWYDPSGMGEGGFPYSKDFSKTNVRYFKAADRRIQHLIENGLVPCIVGTWGYYIKWTGIERMRKHWRNLIARWAAYPVIWCVAGETTMPYYLSDSREEDQKFQKRAWTEIARFIKETDPFNHPITTHPTRFGQDA